MTFICMSVEGYTLLHTRRTLRLMHFLIPHELLGFFLKVPHILTVFWIPIRIIRLLRRSRVWDIVIQETVIVVVCIGFIIVVIAESCCLQHYNWWKRIIKEVLECRNSSYVKARVIWQTWVLYKNLLQCIILHTGNRMTILISSSGFILAFKLFLHL